jgi:hypothetical protein
VPIPKTPVAKKREAKARLSALLHDEVPAARDTLWLALAEARGILDAIFCCEEVRETAKRVADIIALEEIGRSVRAVAASLQATREAVARARFL